MSVGGFKFVSTRRTVEDGKRGVEQVETSQCFAMAIAAGFSSWSKARDRAKNYDGGLVNDGPVAESKLLTRRLFCESCCARERMDRSGS
jgi:hypothetical protein